MFTRAGKAINFMMLTVLMGIIRLYQYCISPFLPKTCRFEPSCSRYALSALHDFGVLRGIMLSFRRVCRCHPFNQGGYDPLPPNNGD